MWSARMNRATQVLAALALVASHDAAKAETVGGNGNGNNIRRSPSSSSSTALALGDDSVSLESDSAPSSRLTNTADLTDEEIITKARRDIDKLITDALPDVNLAAKFVRFGFHSCVGGCDGCLDMSNPDNAGLDIPIAALKPVIKAYEPLGLTRADVWVLSALEASAFASRPQGGSASRSQQPFPFTMNWIGRPNCEDVYDASDCVEGNCSAERGPHWDLPSPNLSTHELLDYFEENFDFDARDTVAIMGSHGLGGLARENSGFTGLWTAESRTLDNGYYLELVGGQTPEDDSLDPGDYKMTFVDNAGDGYSTPDRWQWELPIGTTGASTMINSDVAIVRDLSDDMADDGEVSTCGFNAGADLPGCPFAEETYDIAVEYRLDQNSFLTDFEDAFTRMLEWGVYDTSPGCDEPPCTLDPVSSTKNLKVWKAEEMM